MSYHAPRRSKWPSFWTMLVVLALVSLVGYLLGWRLLGTPPPPPPPPPPLPDQVQATLWLPVEGPDGFGLKAFKRLLPRKNLPLEVAKALLAGPRPGEEALNLMPAGAQLLGVSLKGPVAEIDLSREFRDNLPAGEQATYLLVYSLVNSLCELDEVTEVQLLIEGQPLRSLGELDLGEPLPPDETLEVTGGP